MIRRHVGEPVIGRIILTAGRKVWIAVQRLAITVRQSRQVPTRLLLNGLKVARPKEPTAVHVHGVSPLGFDMVCLSSSEDHTPCVGSSSNRRQIISQEYRP